jgi:hypothetical protein
MAYYKTGTISVAEGSDVVVGLGTAWVDSVRVGDMIRLPNGQQHEILARGSDTLLNIFPAYSGPSVSGQPYFVVPVPGYGKKLYDELALAVRQFGDSMEKLEGVAVGATKNCTDDYLLNRENHTGKQASDTVEGVSVALKKLEGVDDGATKNKKDSELLARENHTGSLNWGWCTYGGTANAITLAAAYKREALSHGDVLRFRATSTNTGASTIKLDGLAAVPAVTVTGAAMPAGYIRTGVDTVAVYDGARWIVDRAPEHGSNANGTYTRYADGRQFCEYSATVTQAAEGAYGMLFQGTREWIFPAVFIAPPSATIGSFLMSTGASWGTLYRVSTTTSAGLRVMDVVTRPSQSTQLNVSAQGLWY